MKNKYKIDLIIKEIKSMNSEQILELNNLYFEDCIESMIFHNNKDFFQTFFFNNPMDAVRLTQFGNYDFHDKYIKFNCEGNLDSFDYLDHTYIPDHIYNVAEFVLNNPKILESYFETELN